MKKTNKEERKCFDIIIAIGSLFALIYANGLNYLTFFVWILLNIIYIVFISNRWYDLMDRFRNKILPPTTDSFENPDYNYRKKKGSH